MQTQGQVTNMQQASRLVMAQPATRELQLGNGAVVTVRRLDWISFELLWQELCSLLSAWPDGPEIDEVALAEQLGQAPGLVLKLCALATGFTESELAALDHACVLEIASAALDFNFSEPAGLRDFFNGLAGLWQTVQQPAADRSASPSGTD